MSTGDVAPSGLHRMSALDVRSVAQDLETRLGEYLEDLSRLVGIDSGTFDKPGADQVGEILQQRYQRLGAFLEVFPGTEYGDNRLIVFEGKGRGSVLLLGHTDTVYAAGTASRRPFRIEGSRAVGPGTADMKAGDLSILYAIEALHRIGWDDFGRIEVLHNADEEIGSPSSRELIRNRAEEADAVLVLEAARESGKIVSARKGIAACRVEVTGKPAHAGVNHHLGRNAVLELSHLVVALEGINGALPGVTLNVGRIEGGDRVNVVPENATARLEVRAAEWNYLVAAMDRVREIVAHRTVEGTEASVHIEIEHRPMQKSASSARLLQRAQEVAADLGFEVDDVATGGASDGNTAASAGKPVLDGLGPIGGAAHSPDEYIAIPSIVPRTALLAGLIASIGSGIAGIGDLETL